MSHRMKRVFNLAPLLVIGCATTGAPGSRQPIQGVQFAIDTAETPAPAKGAFRTVAGVVQFAAGRGRLDVIAVRVGPAVVVHGVTIAAPLAISGDYYLFDSTGFIVVRPATRTFSGFALSRSSWRHGDVREPDGEGFVKFGPLRADTLALGDSIRLAQHGPVTIRWHLDRKQRTGPVTILARGRHDLADAPAGEVSVVRWFGAARALATMPGGVDGLPVDSLQVTAAVLLGSQRTESEPEGLIVLHDLLMLTSVQMDPARLLLPAGYAETSWPVSEFRFSR